VVDLNEVVGNVVEVARSTQYIDKPVLVALKVLAEAGRVDLGICSLDRGKLKPLSQAMVLSGREASYVVKLR
jgi:hypothetical protein